MEWIIRLAWYLFCLLLGYGAGAVVTSVWHFVRKIVKQAKAADSNRDPR